MGTIREPLRAAAIAVLMLATCGLPGTPAVEADEGGSSWGYGKTYQNNWKDTSNGGCQWYDAAHDSGGPYGCYRGVWSDTEANWGDGVSVYEYALSQTWGFWPGEFGTYVYYISRGASPSSASGSWYAATNHYYNGSCAWPVNVIGYAYHYGNGSGYIYTESNWGCEYVEIGSFC